MILVAIEGYRDRHGRLPDALNDLVPEWFDQLPDDPYSPDGFVYRVLAEPDAKGRRYVLYSVFEDGVDNGGTQERWRHSFTSEGMDLVLTER